MFTVGSTNEFVRVKWIEETLKKIPPELTIPDAGAGELLISLEQQLPVHLDFLTII